jgi:hypothetical protein
MADHPRATRYTRLEDAANYARLLRTQGRKVNWRATGYMADC